MRSSILVLLSVAILGAGSKDDAKLKSVTRLAVDGDGPVAERAREFLRSGDTCFVLSDDDHSDATLELTQKAEESRTAVSSIVGGPNKMSVVGAIVLRSGENLWSQTLPLQPWSGSMKLTVDYLIRQAAKKASCKDRVLANKGEKSTPAAGKNGDNN